MPEAFSERNCFAVSPCLAWHGLSVGRMIRYSQTEKMEIIHLVELSKLSIRKTLKELDVPRSSFYRWYQKYQREGYDGLADKKPKPSKSGTRYRKKSRSRSSARRWTVQRSPATSWPGSLSSRRAIFSRNRVCIVS